MKVFEVLTQYASDDEIIDQRQFVTSADDTLKSVTDYFSVECGHLGHDLIGVREILTIVQHIKN